MMRHNVLALKIIKLLIFEYINYLLHAVQAAKR